MITRNYHIKVKLEIHAITCPGVCLCPNGSVELTIRTLGYFLTTNQAPPRFPIIYHDTFFLEGYFKTVNSLAQLEDALRGEKIEIAMWQNGRRLAYCTETLYSFLLDRSFRIASENYNKRLEMNGSVLMKPSSCFPGIIGPKVEYASHVTMVQPDYPLGGERDMGRPQTTNCGRKKDVFDTQNANFKAFRRQKPVCHYAENSQTTKDKRYHHSERQHRNFAHKNFEPKIFQCDCVCDDDSSSVNFFVENHSHQQHQYPQTAAPRAVPATTKTMKNHENFNELKTVTNPAHQQIICHCCISSCHGGSHHQLPTNSQGLKPRVRSDSSCGNSSIDSTSSNCREYLKNLHDKCRHYLSGSDYSHSPTQCETCTNYRKTFNL